MSCSTSRVAASSVPFHAAPPELSAMMNFVFITSRAAATSRRAASRHHALLSLCAVTAVGATTIAAAHHRITRLIAALPRQRLAAERRDRSDNELAEIFRELLTRARHTLELVPSEVA